jgi:hypothetical protein
LSSGKGYSQKKDFTEIPVVIPPIVYLLHRFIKQNVDFRFGMILYFGDDCQTGLFPDSVGTSDIIEFLRPYPKTEQSHPYQH